MLPAAHFERRQLWNVATTTSSPTSTQTHHHCTPFTLPSLGIIAINPSETITLTADAVFTPECTTTFQQSNHQSLGGPTSITDMRDPFNSSVTPQVFVTGATTVMAWMLIIMLIITPRTFFVGGAGGTSGLLRRRGMISGATGSASIIGVGSRPWLQKVAALTVAVSMTMATADTFRVAERQYEAGYMDASALREEVVGGLEIKISRIVSDIFLWLAQVQTLIRLFSRHKEKVIIKWVGFALIVLDMTFSILNSFLGNNSGRARHFENAIPALNYLFQCALSMLYAAWVIYYAITKRRYAFYHSMMWNISLVAFLSIIAILTPLAFFITDISNYNVAGWGDYFRWVGAAAASVIVWEWVERIEALEREEKKDGILGREVFDGDDMLEIAASEEVNWPMNRHSRGHPGGPGGGLPGGRGAYSSGVQHRGSNSLAHQLLRASLRESGIMVPLGRAHSYSPDQKRDSDDAPPAFSGYAPIPTPPPAIASPVSRTDTTSASTVYTVRYHTFNEPTTPQARKMPGNNDSNLDSAHLSGDNTTLDEKGVIETKGLPDEESHVTTSGPHLRWGTLPNPFKKRKASPPPEVLGGRVIESLPIETEPLKQPVHNYGKWDLKARLGVFAAEQSEKIRERASGKQVEMNLPVTIIPAQPRGRTWSPDSLQAEAERNGQAVDPTLLSEPEQPGNPEGMANVGMSPMIPPNQPTFSSANRPYTADGTQQRLPLIRTNSASGSVASTERGNPFSTPAGLSPAVSRGTNPFTSPPLSPLPPTTPGPSEPASSAPSSPTKPDSGPRQ